MTPREISQHLPPDLLRVSHDVLIRDVMQVFGVSRQTALYAIDWAVRAHG